MRCCEACVSLPVMTSIVGGDTIEDCIENWSVILAKIDKHNLKLAPKKLRIFMENTEVYGHKVSSDGKVRPPPMPW